jgi:hypothetical protein
MPSGSGVGLLLRTDCEGNYLLRVLRAGAVAWQGRCLVQR